MQTRTWFSFVCVCIDKRINIVDNDYKLITEFDMQLIADYFSGLNRQGPGGDEETRKALSFVSGLPNQAKIVDLGCGTGQQTQVLATSLVPELDCQITAVDILPELIEGLQQRCKRMGDTGKNITSLLASMTELPFEDETFDLIWAEGSIYNIGFEKGFKEWKRFLKPGGYIACTECSWLSNARPEKTNYFTDNFPEIDNISGKLRVIENAGYMPIAHFILPEYCWTTNYYEPMHAYMQQFLEWHNHSEAAKVFVEQNKIEIEYYNRYKHFHGYVFYIAKKLD